MVADEPVEPAPAGPAARDRRRPSSRSCAPSWPPSTRPRTAASCWSRSPAATASRATPTWRPTSSASCSRASRARLSAAALETLAIVAYKQPISRAQVAAIRGVNVDGVMRTLQQRGYIAEVGRDPGPGQAVLFGTTPHVPRAARASTPLDDLPPLGEFVPGADVVEALEHGLRADADDPRRRRRADAGRAPTERRRPPTADGPTPARPTPTTPRRRRPPTTPTSTEPTSREPRRGRAAAEGPGPGRASAAAGSARS